MQSQQQESTTVMPAKILEIRGPWARVWLPDPGLETWVHLQSGDIGGQPDESSEGLE